MILLFLVGVIIGASIASVAFGYYQDPYLKNKYNKLQKDYVEVVSKLNQIYIERQGEKTEDPADWWKKNL